MSMIPLEGTTPPQGLMTFLGVMAPGVQQLGGVVGGVLVVVGAALSSLRSQLFCPSSAVLRTVSSSCRQSSPSRGGGPHGLVTALARPRSDSIQEHAVALRWRQRSK